MKHDKSTGNPGQCRRRCLRATTRKPTGGAINRAWFWNELVKFQKTYWHWAKADLSIKELRAFMATLPADLPEIHSHTQQAIVDDLLDAVATGSTL